MITSKASFLTVTVVGLTIGYGIGKANDVYIAQSATGAANGSGCNNAYAYTYLNTAGNWTSGAPTGTMIGPGSTVHLCGTFVASAGTSGFLRFQGGGTAGNPVTLLFEPDAVLTAPYWGTNGAISDGSNYTVIDGGMNGIIQATANGTGLANQQDGRGISLSNVSSSEIRHITFSNLYVHTANPTDEGGQGTYAIFWNGGSNVTIDNNTCHDVRTCFIYGYSGSTISSNISIYSNTVYNINWGLIIGSGNTNAILNAPVTIHDNVIHDFTLWDDNANYNHHDGVYCFAASAGASLNACSVYNNYIFGDPGTHMNTFIFASQNTGGISCSGVRIFNNVLVNSSSVDFPANGLIQDWCTGTVIANNTLVGSSTLKGAGISVNPGQGVTIENNILSTFVLGIYLNNQCSVCTITASNYNDFYNLATVGADNAGHYYTTLANWQGCTSHGCPASHDAQSVAGNPLLNRSSYQLTNSTSAAWQAGINLTSITIAALGSDKAGVARPAASPPNWDIGAYQSSASSSVTINPPTGITVTVR